MAPVALFPSREPNSMNLLTVVAVAQRPHSVPLQSMAVVQLSGLRPPCSLGTVQFRSRDRPIRMFVILKCLCKGGICLGLHKSPRS